MKKEKIAKIDKDKLISKKAGLSYLQIFILIIASFAFAFLISETSIKNVEAQEIRLNVCCEKTNSGFWCQNDLPENCNTDFRQTPTSCDATSFCRVGCCYDSQEGLCMENTPQKVCNDKNGTWSDSAECDIAQCNLGCCVLGDQAALVTLTRCKKLSSFYGLVTDFRASIQNELTCIGIAQSQDKGACVYEQDFTKTCKFTTRTECETIEAGTTTGNETTSKPEFYKDYLCSAEELGTNCAPTEKTTCVDGKDEVYFVDSCGNPANIYDASKIKDKSYWKKIIDKSESCGYGSANGNADSKSCGNCDYYLGSYCRDASRTSRPNYGDYICKDLNCYDTSDGKDHKHGESWCSYDAAVGDGKDPAGSRHFRHICINGEEIVEACADFRNEICIQDSISTTAGAFSQAGCRVNRWQECVLQKSQKNCDNTDKRDCKWTSGYIFSGAAGVQGSSKPTQEFSSSKGTGGFSSGTGNSSITGGAITGYGIFGGSDDKSETPETKSSGVIAGEGLCSPEYPPGFNFWEGGEATGICNQANAVCVVEYEKKILGGKKCVENCECLEAGWAQKMNNICVGLGDCGGYVNYVGKYTDDGYSWSIDGKVQSAGNIGAGTTGKVVDNLPEPISNLVIALAQAGSWVTGMSLVGGDAWTEAQLERDLARNEAYKQGKSSVAPVATQTSAPESATIGATATSSQAGWSIIKDVPNAYGGIIEGSGVRIPNLVGGKDGFVLGDRVYIWEEGAGWAYSGTPGQLGEFGLSQADKLLVGGKEVSGNFLINSEKGIAINTQTGQQLSFTQEGWKVAAGAGTGAGATPAQAWLAKTLGFGVGTFESALVSGLQWAGMGYIVGYLIGSVAGMSKENQKALSASLALGGFTWEFLEAWSTTRNMWLGKNAFLVGLGVAVVVFLLMYKKESKEVVTFTCNSWQAPIGGDDCEKCNDELEPCSEYRCKSLGQACGILNAGTEEEKCAWLNPHDVKSPGISPWEDALTSGYKYTDVRIRPPGDGSEPGRMRIVKEDGGCVKAWTPLEFGIVTTGPDGISEPAQCKIEYNHTLKFDDMNFWFGESNLYLYNHSQKMNLPSPDALNAAAPELQNDGTYSLYVRCQDGNGNVNHDEFVIRFCVDKGPDVTPPEIISTNIINGMPVQYGVDNLSIELYVNEPAECKWSRKDKSYNDMENSLACSTQVWEMNNQMLYTCKTTLTGIKDREDNQFYFRCKDQPWQEEGNRNVNQQSYEFLLKGTEPLVILETEPNGTIKGSTTTIPVDLKIETDRGYNNGDAICYFSTTNNEDDYIKFFETESNLHNQKQDLTTGNFKYYFKCVDLGGNTAYNSTEFKVEIDKTAPIVARAYQEDQLLKIVTTEDSECRYSTQSCNFVFTDGIDMPYANQEEHVAEWKTDKTYYIKCKDEYGNQPDPTQCSIIIRPYNLVKQK